MSISQEFPDLPPLWALGTAVASVVVGRLVPIWSLPFPAFLLGAALIGAGLGLAAWAALWFRRKRTTIEPRETPATLIVEGPFRINRNPIYTGMTFVIVGIAMMAGTLGSLITAFAFPVIVTTRFIRGEEAALLSSFGAEAERYLARTRRW
ncbi:MAG: isoprenylcysteine carboxylmethyltransferase family protein [Rhizobiaceae bacterium]|nr:isoprenylcysteine carboxylmethyltransferase family protein [Rhizobiaceae bacterium]